MSTTFQKATKLGAAAPLAAAAAVTSTTANFLGRPTTSRTTNELANANAKYLNTLVRHYTNSQQRGSCSSIGNRLQKSYYNSNKYHNHIHHSTLLSRRNFSSAKPSLPKQKSASSTEGVIPPSPSSQAKSLSFLEWYEGHLQARPVQTKMVTGSILWGLGDVVAQVVPQVFFENDNKNNAKDDVVANSANSEKAGVTQLKYDYPRTARAMIFGFGIHAPLSHVHFNLLEWMTVKGGFSGLSIPVFKAFMEQFVYWSWFSNSLYHGTMGAMQGMTPQQIYDRIADVLWDTQKAQWVFWIPVQLLNFRFVPVRHQLNVVLLTSVVWTALLSAWYPPEDEVPKAIEEEDASKKEN